MRVYECGLWGVGQLRAVYTIEYIRIHALQFGELEHGGPVDLTLHAVTGPRTPSYQDLDHSVPSHAGGQHRDGYP